jgi:opacity protein-like surface antigen
MDLQPFTRRKLPVRKLSFLALLLIVCAPAAFAQNSDEYKKVEVFSGYSYESADARTKSRDVVSVNGIPVTDGLTPAGVVPAGVPTTTNTGRTSLNGFNSSVTLYFTENFGLTGDVSGHYRTEAQGFINRPYEARMGLWNFLAGPQYRFTNSSKVTPFVRALFGVAYRSNRYRTLTGAPTLEFEDNNTNFAMALGGGVDVRLNDRFSVRVAQVDYNPVFLRDRTVTLNDGTTLTLKGRTENNLRLSAGIVIH